MQEQKVKVETVSEKKACAADPLSVFKVIQGAHGRESAFILESLSGPSRDRRASVIGVDPLFGIHLYEEKAVLTGPSSVTDILINSLSAGGFEVMASAHSVRYRTHEDVWNMLRAIQNAFQVERTSHYSLSFFGYFSYDTIRFIENIPSIITQSSDTPLIALNVYQTFIVWPVGGGVEVIVNNCSLWPAKTPADYQLFLKEAETVTLQGIHYPKTKQVAMTITKERYCENVEKALSHIRVGDIYQMQLGHEIHVKSDIDPFTVYQALRKNNPSPYMYLGHVGGVDIVGASPELYVRLEHDVIEMRPIAGTAGKKPGVDPKELIAAMTASEKERAEHVMLIDLCRNDMGRVCKPGSLDVDELMVVEEYSHLFHMVSNVKALLRAPNDAWDVLRATFPAGTMTGAPKVRAMELIEGFETSRRGIYAGAVGIIGFDGHINTALCIRSTFRQNGTYHLRASAGVVSDSEAEKEWMETLYKMSSVYRAVTGEELIP